MHINRWLFAGLIYLTFMGLGIISGRTISIYAHNHLNHTPIPTIRELASQKTQKSYPVPTLPKGTPAEDNETFPPPSQQNNYLLLFVDDLNAKKPKLLSAYIWIIQNDANRWTFLPIYDPQLAQPVVNSYTQELVRYFSINNHHQLNQAFMDRLNSHSILWHHFLLIDEQFLTKLSALADANTDTPFKLMQQYCQIIPQTTIDLTPLTAISTKHFYTDAIPSFLLQPHSMALNKFPLECLFPTLSK
ncbi:MAG: hypothetical protein ACPL4H_01735 [Anaerolineales bacterium]